MHGGHAQRRPGACRSARQRPPAVHAAHFTQGPNGPPKPLIDVGKPGFNQPGDSVLWMAGRTSVKVTAAPGTVLRYFCLIHPWMQGTIHVIK